MFGTFGFTLAYLRFVLIASLFSRGGKMSPICGFESFSRNEPDNHTSISLELVHNFIFGRSSVAWCKSATAGMVGG